MGSCMAHLNCLPPRAAGVNFWFFIAVRFGGGCWYKAKCEMLLRKTDGKMNVQNCGFSAKLRNGDGGDMLHDWRQRSYHGLAPSFFEEMTRCRRQNHSRRRPGNPNGPSKFRKYRVYRFYVCLRLRDRDCCSAADGNGSCYAPAPSYFEEMTRCRRQKLHWRWPGNPNDRLKFRNLGLFMFTWSQLMLRRWLHGWWRLSEIALTACRRCQKHRQDDQNRLKFRKYENLCLRVQANCLQKLLFAVTNDAAIDGNVHCFFFNYHSQRLLFSPTKYNFSTTLTPPPKNRAIHIVEFFCRFYLLQSHRYYKKRNLLFSSFRQRAYV